MRQMFRRPLVARGFHPSVRRGGSGAFLFSWHNNAERYPEACRLLLKAFPS